MRRAIYAGTFDPVTNGHLWMIEQANRLFDEVVVAIGENPDKKTLSSLEERLEILREATLDLTNVRITSFENQYLIDFAIQEGAEFIVRGIRNSHDYAYEQAIRNVNEDINPNITTVFLTPPRHLAEVSSSLVKGLIGPTGWEKLVSTYIPETVLQRFIIRQSSR